MASLPRQASKTPEAPGRRNSFHCAESQRWKTETPEATLTLGSIETSGYPVSLGAPALGFEPVERGCDRLLLEDRLFSHRVGRWSRERIVT